MKHLRLGLIYTLKLLTVSLAFCVLLAAYGAATGLRMGLIVHTFRNPLLFHFLFLLVFVSFSFQLDKQEFQVRLRSFIFFIGIGYSLIQGFLIPDNLQDPTFIIIKISSIMISLALMLSELLLIYYIPKVEIESSHKHPRLKAFFEYYSYLGAAVFTFFLFVVVAATIENLFLK